MPEKNDTIREQRYYKVRGISNLIAGFVGVVVVNKIHFHVINIPELLIWLLHGCFALIEIYAFYCIHKITYKK